MHFFFFNDTATTEIYTLSLHDALPIFMITESIFESHSDTIMSGVVLLWTTGSWSLAIIVFIDRKSTRLNSSHANISYAVFCLKKTHTTTRCAGEQGGNTRATPTGHTEH